MSYVKPPTLLQSLIPIVFLTVFLAVNVGVFRDLSTEGSNQIVLILSASVAAIIGMKMGYTWEHILNGVVKNIQSAIPAILILLLIGALSGTWMLSGIVPSMIYYGVQILSPSVFLVASCVVCSLVSLSTGSSWTTSATIGVALIGVGKVLGIHEGMVAGAILSGAYFGDKLSPLSDTTNLAPAMAGTDLFTHIRYMLITTIPTMLITLLIFLLLGFFQTKSVNTSTDTLIVMQAIESKFNITGWIFIVPLTVIFLIIRKVPAIPSLLIGTLMAAVMAIIFQPNLVKEVSSENSLRGYFMGIMISMYGKMELNMTDPTLKHLFSTRGMSGMLNTVWLIISAMCFGGVMESVGMLKKITESIIKKVKSNTSLVSYTSLTCMFFNATASDQYLSLLVPGRMYTDIYRKRDLAPENLSRTLEDSGTVTSVLVPWNTCGAYHASVLGVNPLMFIPYCFFSIISPFMTIFISAVHYKIKMLDKK